MDHNPCRIAAALALALAGTTAQAFDGFGEWRGQAQYLASKHGQPAPEIQELVPLVIRIDPDGKVVGTSTENGCRLQGLASPVAQNVMRVDVTFRDCTSKELNRRLSGTVAHYPGEKRLAFSVSLIDSTAKPVTRYEISAGIMRR
ncbi:MAG TPA: hypothetical protein PKV98_01680 [Burkholderiaceae bacterium]|nr:hypothetical protein [Burkholderiaceae bacterium]